MIDMTLMSLSLIGLFSLVLTPGLNDIHLASGLFQSPSLLQSAWPLTHLSVNQLSLLMSTQPTPNSFYAPIAMNAAAAAMSSSSQTPNRPPSSSSTSTQSVATYSPPSSSPHHNATYPFWDKWMDEIFQAEVAYQRSNDSPLTVRVVGIFEDLSLRLPILLKPLHLIVMKYPHWRKFQNEGKVGSSIEEQLPFVGVPEVTGKINQNQWSRLMIALHPHFEFGPFPTVPSSSTTSTSSVTSSDTTSTPDPSPPSQPSKKRKATNEPEKCIESESEDKMSQLRDFMLKFARDLVVNAEVMKVNYSEDDALNWIATGTNIPHEARQVFGIIRGGSKPDDPMWYCQSLSQLRASCLGHKLPFRLNGAFSFGATSKFGADRGAPHVIPLMMRSCYGDGPNQVQDEFFSITVRSSSAFSNKDEDRNRPRPELERCPPISVASAIQQPYQEGVLKTEKGELKGSVVDATHLSYLRIVRGLRAHITTDLPCPQAQSGRGFAQPFVVHILPDGRGMIVGFCIETSGDEQNSLCRLKAKGEEFMFEIPYTEGGEESGRYRVWFLYYTSDPRPLQSMTVEPMGVSAILNSVRYDSTIATSTSASAASRKTRSTPKQRYPKFPAFHLDIRSFCVTSLPSTSDTLSPKIEFNPIHTNGHYTSSPSTAMTPADSNPPTTKIQDMNDVQMVPRSTSTTALPLIADAPIVSCQQTPNLQARRQKRRHKDTQSSAGTSHSIRPEALPAKAFTRLNDTDNDDEDTQPLSPEPRMNPTNMEVAYMEVDSNQNSVDSVVDPSDILAIEVDENVFPTSKYSSPTVNLGSSRPFSPSSFPEPGFIAVSCETRTTTSLAVMAVSPSLNHHSRTSGQLNLAKSGFDSRDQGYVN